MEGRSNLFDAFQPKNGVTLRAGSILKKGMVVPSLPIVNKPYNTLAVLQNKAPEQRNIEIHATPRIFKNRKALSSSKVSAAGRITIHSDFAKALQAPTTEVMRYPQRCTLPSSKVPLAAPAHAFNASNSSSPFDEFGMRDPSPKLPVLPPHLALPAQKRRDKMHVIDGRAARAIPGASEIQAERKSRMLYGNRHSKKQRRGGVA